MGTNLPMVSLLLEDEESIERGTIDVVPRLVCGSWWRKKNGDVLEDRKKCFIFVSRSCRNA